MRILYFLSFNDKGALYVNRESDSMHSCHVNTYGG